ncbi:MAG TPA: hypothetical protein VKA65_15285, partial [Acidimicrobiales bacterium]|nr:hypothetical protein [Acidimicrobiales bacterium]
PPTTVPPTTAPATTAPPTTAPPTTVPPAPIDTCDASTPAGLTWTGQLPSGLYTLELRGTGAEACLSLTLPAGVRPTAEGTPDALTGAWRVSSADGRHVVWGLAPSDVTEVVVGVATPDGAASEVRAVTLPPGPAGITHRAFALVLPECVSITSLTGVGAAGPRVTAPDLSALAAVAGYDPTVTATVPVG